MKTMLRLAVVVAALAMALPASAANITLINTQAFGNSWDNGADWSDGLAAHPGDDYHVGDSTGKGLRTPNDVFDPVFPGDSLTFHATGTLGTKHHNTATFNDLRLDGGTIATWVGNRPMAIGGTLTVLSASRLDAGGTNDRDLRIEAQIAGSGDLTVTGNTGNGTVWLSNGSNTYTGNWDVASGHLTAFGNGSLGPGNVTVGANGSIDIAYNRNVASNLTIDGQMILDNTLTVGQLTIAGAAVAAGTYSHSDLNSVFDANFVDGGFGSITATVGPPAGAIYELNKGQAFGTDWNVGADWTNTGDNSTGVVPAFGTTANMARTLRTPTSTATHSFGAELNILPGGGVLLKTRGTAALLDAHLLGGSLSQGIAPNSTGAFGGNIAVDANSTLSINSTATDTRTMILSATLSGGAQLTVDGGNGAGVGTLALTADNSGYSGTWSLRDGALLHAQAANSLGTGAILVPAGNSLDIDYDLLSPTASLNLGGTMVLDQHIALGQATVNGASLAPGVHPFHRLNAAHDANFVDGGSGTLTVLAGLDVYELNKNQPFGTDWNVGADWTNLGDFSTGVVPPAGSLALVPHTLRTPTSTATHTFGAQLAIQPGGAVLLKTRGTAVLSDAFLQGGSLSQGIAPNSTGSIGGSITVVEDSTISINSNVNTTNPADDDTRTMILAADVAGGAQLTVDGGDGVLVGTLRLTGDNSAYTGIWRVLDNAFIGIAAGSTLGTGGIRVEHGAITVADGAVVFGAPASPANVYIGNRTAGGAGNRLGTVDLSAAASFTAHLTNLDLGTTRSGANLETAQGILSLPATNVIDANRLLISDSTNSAQTGLGVASELHLGMTNTLTINTVTVAGRKGEAIVDIAPGGSLDLRAQGGGRADLYVARNNFNTGTIARGTLDLSAGASFTALLDDFILGQKTDGGSGKAVGKVILADTNHIDADLILIGDSADAGQSEDSTLTLGRVNTILANIFTVGGRKSDATAILPAGGSLTLGSAANPTELNVSYNNAGTASQPSATLDLSGGVFNADLARVRVGVKSGGNTGTANGTWIGGTGGTVNIGTGTSDDLVIARITSGTADNAVTGLIDLSGSDAVNINVDDILIGTTNARGRTAGTLILGNTNTIIADAITLSDTEAGSTPGQNLSTLSLGLSNDISANTITVGARKGQGAMDIVAGGSVTIGGNSSARANLFIGRNNRNTGARGSGVVDLSQGALLDATLDQLVIGQKTGGGSGGADGSLVLAASNVIDANTVLIGNHANGPSGAQDAAGTVTIALGGTLELGTASNPADLYIGRKTAGSEGLSMGTMDLSGGASFTAHLDELGIGTVAVSGGQGKAWGTLILADTNVIDANTITIGDSPHVGLGGFTNTVTLGRSNTITADTVVVGGSKATSRLEIVDGGTMGLGTPAERADLVIGTQHAWTSGGANGTVDLANGTLHAWLDELIIGDKRHATAAGTTRGTMSFAAGTIDANSILLARRNGTVGAAIGTLDFSGGTLTAGSITSGGGTAAFNWTGGTLSVDQFGSAASPINLLNTGGGTLAPAAGGGTMALFGDYEQGANAILEVAIGGTGAGEFGSVDVQGGVKLAGVLDVILGFAPTLRDEFIIINNDGTDKVEGIFAGLPEGTFFEKTFGGTIYPFRINYAGGTGNDVVLTQIPEPATLTLLGLSVVGLVARRRRKR